MHFVDYISNHSTAQRESNRLPTRHEVIKQFLNTSARYLNLDEQDLDFTELLQLEPIDNTREIQ